MKKVEEVCPHCGNLNSVDDDIVIGICEYCKKRMFICNTCTNQKNCYNCNLAAGMCHTKYCSGGPIAVFASYKNDNFLYWKLISDTLETKQELLWWQKRNLMFTSTGYGNRIPTDKKLKFRNRWHRIFCAIHSNIGTCYIEVKQFGRIIIG